MSAKNLAQNVGPLGGAGDINCDLSVLGQIPDIMLPECPCNFTDLPLLGSANSEGWTKEAIALQ